GQRLLSLVQCPGTWRCMAGALAGQAGDLAPDRSGRGDDDVQRGGAVDSGRALASSLAPPGVHACCLPAPTPQRSLPPAAPCTLSAHGSHIAPARRSMLNRCYPVEIASA